MENRTRSSHCLSPRRLQTVLWSLHTHSCKFHLVRVVFSCSVLRIHIIQTSYLHYIGFHQHNSYKRFFYSTPVICVEILLRRRETVKLWEECLWVASRQSHFLLIQETSVREEKGLAQTMSRQPTLGFFVFIRSKNIGGAPIKNIFSDTTQYLPFQ